MQENKIKLREMEGRTLEERENCFPNMQKNNKRVGHVRNDG